MYQDITAYLCNPANYKKTRKKKYEIWACMPNIGTKIVNRLEACEYTTVWNDEPKQNKCFVLSGTVGEQWVISEEKLCNTYTLASDNSAITRETLSRLMKQSKTEKTIQWFKVATKLDEKMSYFACFVPVNIEFQIACWGQTFLGNRKGVPHGKGDFVLCPNINGVPNLNECWIVNGEVFVNTYDNRGFSDCIDHSAIKRIGEVSKPVALISKL